MSKEIYNDVNIDTYGYRQLGVSEKPSEKNAAFEYKGKVAGLIDELYEIRESNKSIGVKEQVDIAISRLKAATHKAVMVFALLDK